MANPNPPNSTFQVFQVVWGALLLSQFMYAFVLFKVILTGVDPVAYRWLPRLSDPFEAAFVIAGAGVAFASFAVPAHLAQSAAQKSRRNPSEEEKKIPSPSLFPAFITRLGLLEAVCLFGFMLSIREKNPGLIVPFLAVSAIGYVRNFPSDPEKLRRDLGV